MHFFILDDGFNFIFLMKYDKKQTIFSEIELIDLLNFLNNIRIQVSGLVEIHLNKANVIFQGHICRCYLLFPNTLWP